MPPANPGNEPLDGFVSMAWRDFDAGRLRPLDEYLALFPDDPDGVAREYRRLTAEFAADTTEGVGDGRDPEPGPGALIDAFRIVQELGSGGQGTVYLADDLRLGRRVAVKVLTHLAAADPAVLARFRREARITSRLDHPGLCTVYETGVFKGTPWIAMRHVEGESLARRIAGERGAPASWATEVDDQVSLATGSAAQSPPLTPTAVSMTSWLDLIRHAADALHAAHEAGVVHRDLKPGNIMVTPEDQPVILDFGLARDDEVEGTALTQPGQAFGTPLYMSPEQTRGEALDRRSDVWSLGATLYECLTFQPPFSAPTRARLYQAIQGEDPVPLRRANPSATRDMETIVATALDKDPARRYQTAWDLAEDLRRVVEREPIRARPAGALLRLRRLVQRNPVPAAIAAMLILSLSVGLVISTILLGQRDEALGRAEYEEARSAAAAARAGFEAARQAAGRGKWDAVLENLADAERRGYPDTVAISILRVQALDARLEIDAALDELSRLEERADLGDRRGETLFLRGEIGVDRWDDPEGGVAQFEAALELTLPDAMRAYIEAMLAPTAAAAIEHARRSLEIDPANRYASELLGSLLVVSGRLDEALAEITRTRALLPDAPGPLLIEASCHALRGDDERSDRLVAQAAQRLPKAQAAMVPIGTKMFQAVRAAVAEGAQGPGKTTANLMKVARLTQTMIRQKPSEDTRFPVRVPPPLVRHVKEIKRTGPSPYSIPSILKLIQGRPDPALVTAAEKLATYLDEGTTTFALAIFALGDKQGRTDDDIQRLFEKAAGMPSVLPIRRMALLQSLWLQINTAVATGLPTDSPEFEPRRRRLRETYRKLAALGPPTKGEMRIVLQAVGLFWNDPLFLPLGWEWSLRHPESGTGWFIIGFTAMGLGAYGPAVKAFDECLARDPKNTFAPQFRAQCWEKLGRIGVGAGAMTKAEYEASKRSKAKEPDTPKKD